MEGKITYNNILLILTEKLHLLNILNKRVCRIIAKFLVNDRF